MVKGIEVALQGDGCSHGIVRRVAAQQLLGLKTGTPLVNQYHIHTKTAMQLVSGNPTTTTSGCHSSSSAWIWSKRC